MKKLTLIFLSAIIICQAQVAAQLSADARKNITDKGIDFIFPDGYQSVAVVPNDLMKYDFGVKSSTQKVEGRFAFRDNRLDWLDPIQSNLPPRCCSDSWQPV